MYLKMSSFSLHFHRIFSLYRFLINIYFSFCTLKKLFHYHLSSFFWLEVIVIHIILPLYVMCCFPLATFKTFFLIFGFSSLNIICLGVCVCFAFIKLLESANLHLSLNLWNFGHYGFRFFFLPYFSFPSGTPMTCMLDISAGSHVASTEVKVLVVHLCPTLCNPMDCSPLGSSVNGISQARILEWVAMPSSKGSFWPRDWTHIP